MVGFPGLSVPLGGVGVVGMLGAWTLTVDADAWAGDFDALAIVVRVPRLAGAPKLNIASERAEKQRSAVSRLRAVIKPDLAEDCFFMGRSI